MALLLTKDKTVHKAVQMGLLDILKIFLCILKIDPNLKDSNNLTPLHISVLNAKYECFDYLLSNENVDLEIKTPEGATALYLATYFALYTRCVKPLVAAGANIDTPEDGGLTPIIKAANDGNINIGKLLIEKGCNLELKTKTGATAIYSAVLNGHAEFVELLLFSGSKCDDVGNYSLMYVAANYGYVRIINLLIKAGCNLDQQMSCGSTALVAAVNAKSLSAVKALAAAGCNVNISIAENGYSPLFIAAKLGLFGIVKVLLQVPGCLLDYKIYDGCTALHIATEQNHPKIVKALVKRGADVNIKTTMVTQPCIARLAMVIFLF